MGDNQSNSNLSAQLLSGPNGAILAVMQNIDNNSHIPTLKQRITDSQEKINEVISASTAVNDRFGNPLTATGNKDKVKEFNEYGFTNDTLNYSLWTALYNDSWVFRRAIDKPAQDMVKLGAILTVKDDTDDVKKQKLDKALKRSKKDFIKLCKWGGLYGGSIAVVMFDTMQPGDYKNALHNNIKKIIDSKKVRMYVTDRWYGVGYDVNNTVTDMTNIDYGKPKSYNITFANGSSMTVHHDYIIRYEHRDAPVLIKNGQLQGWGYAEGAHILNELSRDDELKSDITSLINKSLIEVIKMDGMRGVFMGSDEASKQQLEQRLQMVNWGRSFNSLTFLDSQDDYQMNSFSGLGGLSDLLEKNMWMISAALEMQGVLYGDLTQGFAHDSEALERYDDTIQGRADDLLRPCYEKFFWIMAQKYEIKEEIEFEFGSLLTEQKNKAKNDEIDKHISRLQNLLDMGIISLEKAGKSFNSFVKTGELGLTLSDKDIEALKEKEQEESEDIDNLL